MCESWRWSINASVTCPMRVTWQVWNSGTVPEKPCHHCGKKNHMPHQCHFKDAVCHKCSKRGHIAKVCRASKPKRDAMTGGKQRKKTQWVQADDHDTSDSETELPVLKVSSRTSHPIRVEKKYRGKCYTWR